MQQAVLSGKTVQLMDYGFNLHDFVLRLFVFMIDKISVKPHREHNESDDGGDNNTRHSNGRGMTVMKETDPCNNSHLNEEQEDTNTCGQYPGNLDTNMHPIVR